jgi:hypothetical protein
MGEFIPRPVDSVPDSKGAGADVGKILQATVLAQQLGKTVEEVLQFMGATSLGQTTTSQPAPSLVDKTLSLPAIEAMLPEDAKGLASSEDVVPAKKQDKQVNDDGFVVTEVVDVSEATDADLAKISEQEEDNQWDDKIRVGSTVKIVYQVNASRINWVGKKGKVVRVVGNEAAKIYEVEFSGRKVAHVQLNKKTGKLERGYKNKPLCNTFSEDQVELA